MAVEPNVPIKDKRLESAAIAQVKAAVQSQGKAVKETKEALASKPKVEVGAEKAKLSKDETETSGSGAGRGRGSDSNPNAAAEGRGTKLNIQS